MNILKFTAELFANQDIDTTGLVIVKDATIVAEEYREPYQKDGIYELFSITKAITAIVALIAIDKGYFKLNDLIINYFPDKLPHFISDNLKKLTVHHVLSMNIGRVDMDFHEIYQHKDWVKAFLALPIPYEPGSVHKYSSHAPHILSAIIKVTTGMTMADFAHIHLFKPLNIEKYHWETWHDGNTVGGMGLALSTNSLAKIGIMLLEKGTYNGKAILSKKYVDQAFTNYIAQNDINEKNYPGRKRGYAFLSYKDSFYHEGSFGQLLFFNYQHNIVISINSRRRIKELLLNMIDKYILNNFYDSKKAKLRKASLLSPLAQVPSKRKKVDFTFRLRDNAHGLLKVVLKGDDKALNFRRIYNDGKCSDLLIKYHQYNKMELSFIKDTSVCNQPAIMSAVWLDENLLEVKTIYIETPYITKYIFEFIDDDKCVKFEFDMSPVLGQWFPLVPKNISLTLSNTSIKTSKK